MADKYRVPANFRIVSGGQTGADQGGLDWAIARGPARWMVPQGTTDGIGPNRSQVPADGDPPSQLPRANGVECPGQ
jgi:hypothetical protein